jgi:hypothetical protein
MHEATQTPEAIVPWNSACMPAFVRSSNKASMRQNTRKSASRMRTCSNVLDKGTAVEKRQV